MKPEEQTARDFMNKRYLSTFLFFVLTQIPSISLANTIFFPIIQGQSQAAEWNCKCPKEEQCQIENLQDKQVLTVPPQCVVETGYTYPNDHNVQAIRLEISSLETLGSVNNVYIIQHESPPGIRSIKSGVNTVSHNNDSATITAYANRVQFNKPILGVYNSLSVPLHLIEAKVHHSKQPRIGAILKAVGGGLQGSYTYDDTLPNYAWIPLPLDYKSQVPLYIDLNIQPQTLIQSIQYQADDLGNWGAVIYFVPNITNGTKIDFIWHIAVLTNDAIDSNASYQFIQNTTEWLTSTDIVQASDSRIQKTAYSLLAPDSNTKTITQIVSWLSTHIESGIDGFRLDALHVYETKKGTCTGFANLAAALGRSLNIPSRTLAVYWVGQKQETHWINEFYLDESQSWIRVEPQGSTSIDSETYIPVRIDRIHDEVVWEMLMGIPKQAYPIIPVDFTRPNNQYYLVEAFNALEFTESTSEMNKIFYKAKKSWYKDFQILLNTGQISAKRQAIRHQISEAQSLSEVYKLLIELDRSL